MLIDQLLPHWHFREHHRRATTAAPGDLLAAVDLVTWADVPVMRNLMRVRSAGGLRLSPNRPILEDMTRIGFTALARTDREIVVGAIGRPWSPGGGAPREWAAATDPGGVFTDFTTPGWAKMIFSFHASAGDLTTETRVLLTDDRSRRPFMGYWIVIRPFSGLIRRRWLTAIARRADRA